MSRTILVVDNNAFYRQVLGDFFTSEGYEVAVAQDGVEALERITLGGIDFILLDLIMPRIDGARLCRFLKAHPSYAAIPVVILSGILADEIEGLDTINADAYVAKMPMDQLQVMLRTVFKKLEGRPSQPVLEGFDRMYRREVVLELLEERRVRELLLDSLTEGIVELTSDRRILRTNQVFEKMTGRTASEILSAPVTEMFEGSSFAVEALFESVGDRSGQLSTAIVTLQGRSFRLRLHRLEREGACLSTLNPTIRRVALENPKVRLIEPGSLPGFILLVEDVTEQLRIRQERERFRERLARSERMSALGMFVAGAAHELNNPLTSVLGYAQLLEGKPLSPEVKTHLRKIEEGATRCKAIVEHLLLFSHRERGDRRRALVADLVSEAVAESASRAAELAVDVRILPSDVNAAAEISSGEILQALSAIIDNAVRAAAEGAGGRRVDVRTLLEGQTVVVEVADSGPGIPAPILGRIFDPFFGTREVGDGKGLGLSVAYGIVRGHDGELSARNVPGSGACLTIRIPAAAADARAADTLKVAAPPAPARRGGKILLVDDEPVVLDLLTDVLGEIHEIETATNGREGLARAGKGSYDLIILDIKMPDMTGRQMYEALLAQRPEMAERVIFTTGDSVQEETRAFLERVGNPYITKPFSLDAITEIVDRLLSASRPA